MTDKIQKIRQEVEKLKSNLLYGACASQVAMETRCKEEAYNEVLAILDSMREEPVSEDLEEAVNAYIGYAPEVDESSSTYGERQAFKAGAQWQKEHLWKPDDGDNLPEIDREVIVLIKYNTQRNIHDEEYPTYRVGFGHRPNPDGWDGKNIITGKVTRNYPKTYGKGGWNIPNVKWWLDCSLPNKEED